MAQSCSAQMVSYKKSQWSVVHSWIRNDVSISGALEFWGGSDAPEQKAWTGDKLACVLTSLVANFSKTRTEAGHMVAYAELDEGQERNRIISLQTS